MVDGTSVTLERISKMLNAVNGTVNVNAAQQTAAIQAQNLPFRGRTDFERTPDSDTYETGKKHKGLKRLVGLSALTAIGLAIASFVKGKGKLPEGSKLGDIMKTGWNEVKISAKNLWNKVMGKTPDKIAEKRQAALGDKIKGINEKTTDKELLRIKHRVDKYGTEEQKQAFEKLLTDDRKKVIDEALKNYQEALGKDITAISDKTTKEELLRLQTRAKYSGTEQQLQAIDKALENIKNNAGAA